MKSRFIIWGVVGILLLSMVVSTFGAAQKEKASIPPLRDEELLGDDRIGNPNAKTTITWLNHPNFTIKSPVTGMKEHLEKAFIRWARNNLDFQINISVFPLNIDEAMTRLQEQAAAGRAPDFSLIDSFFLPRFIPYLQPLDHLVPKEEVDDFVEFARKEMTQPDGKIRAFWFFTDCRVLYYRKDLIPNPPRTWEELIQIASDFSKRGITGYIYPGGRGEPVVMEHLPMFWAQGGELVDGTGRPIFAEGANREAWIKVLRFLRETITSGASPARVVNFNLEANMLPEVYQHNVAMWLGGSWQIRQLQDNLGERLQVWDVTFPPKPTKDAPDITAVGGWTIGVFTKDPAKQRAIVNLIREGFAGTEGMRGFVTALRALPTRQSVIAAGGTYLNDPYIQKFFDMVKKGGRPRPGALIYPTISRELQVAITSVIAGNRTPEQAIDEAGKRVAEEYSAMKR
jgi:multiple sugar transport system substrate-binding protein